MYNCIKSRKLINMEMFTQQDMHAFFIFPYLDRPGPVELTSSDSNGSSVTIAWMPPLDENGLPHIVELNYSYHLFKTVTVHKMVSCTSWTVDNLKSDVPVFVHFSLKAVNRKGMKGPSTSGIVCTKPIGENVIVHMHETKQYKN